MNTFDKAALRKQLLSARQQVNTVVRATAGLSAARHLSAHPLFQASQDVAAFSALPDEFDSYPLIEAIFAAGKHCHLPMLQAGGRLSFAGYHPEDPLQPNRYGILEPASGPVTPLSQLDMVLVPLVGFDQLGHRLGRGGGYYDRTFQGKRHACLIGTGYALQGIKQLPSDPWDVPLDGILTEKGLVLFREVRLP